MTVVERGSRDVPSPSSRVSRRLFFLFAGIFCLLFFLFGILFSFRVLHVRTGFFGSLSRVIPYPAAVVDGQVIWYAEVVRLAEVFDAHPVEDTDPFEASLMLLMRRAVVEMYAERLDLSVTDQDREAFSQDAGMFVFSWKEATYEKYVIDPLILAQKVEAALQSSSEAQEIARERMAKIQMDLQAGMDFEGLARYRSEDPAAPLGGDLGFFTREDLPPGLETAFDLPVGGVSDILEEPDFFVIAKVYEERLDESGHRIEVALRVISVHKATLSEIVDAYLVDHPPKSFVD